MPAATSSALRTEDDAAVALPLDARMSRGSLAMAWAGICSAMVYLFLGATLALGYGARNAVIGMVLAVIAFGLLCGSLARFSARTGLSSAALSQAMLGRAGGAVATLILCVTGTYYAVFEGSVLAVAIHKVVPALGYGMAAFLVAAYSTPLVLGSVQNWLNRLNGFLLPFYLLGLAALVFAAIGRGGAARFWSVGASDAVPYGWWFCFCTYLGVLVMAMCTLDFARFGRPQDAHWHARWTFGIPFYAVTYLLNGVVGILLVASLEAASVTETAVVDASLGLLGVWVGLAWVFISQTRINTANFLIGALNLQAFVSETSGRKLPKAVCALAIGVVTFALMRSTDVFRYLIVALNWQAVFTTAWVGVALSFVIASARGMPAEQAGHGGLYAWLIAAFLGGVTLVAGGQVGTYWFPVVTLLAAVVVHVWFVHRALRAATPI